MQKNWIVAEKPASNFKEQFPEINGIVLQLLYNRNIRSQNEINNFINPDYEKGLHDPYLLAGMNQAVDRFFQAIINRERVLVYGDYDADGVCSTVLMADLLKAFGVFPEVYIPFRDTEGYGLNMQAVSEIVKNKIDLVITVDCGIANIQEADFLKQNNVDLIITDHHNPPEVLPKATAIIDPKIKNQKYPFIELSGCGVVFKFAQAILRQKNRQRYAQLEFPAVGFEKWLLDLVAISTVTDLCQLVGENRILLHFGLIVLKKSKRIGIKELVVAAGLNINKIDSGSIGFQLGPRLNAAGRMDHASASYELLITNDEKEANKIAADLNKKNSKRQALTEKIHQQALEQIGEAGKQKILFAKSDDWPTGIVGLVSGKITDAFFRPSIIIGKNKEGKIIGSGRSIPGFDITNALQKSRQYLSHFGGHTLACGFTLKDDSQFDGFKKKMTEVAEQNLQEQDLKANLFIDCEVDLEDINWEFYESIEKFEPFGQSNARPKFLAKGIFVIDAQTVGQNGKHIKIIANHKTDRIRKIIGFCFGKYCQHLRKGDKLDIVFEVSVNEWNGSRELQLKIIDLKDNER